MTIDGVEMEAGPLLVSDSSGAENGIYKMNRETVLRFQHDRYWFYSPQGFHGSFLASAPLVERWRRYGFTIIRVSHARGDC